MDDKFKLNQRTCWTKSLVFMVYNRLSYIAPAYGEESCQIIFSSYINLCLSTIYGFNVNILVALEGLKKAKVIL